MDRRADGQHIFRFFYYIEHSWFMGGYVLCLAYLGLWCKTAGFLFTFCHKFTLAITPKSRSWSKGKIRAAIHQYNRERLQREFVFSNTIFYLFGRSPILISFLNFIGSMSIFKNSHFDWLWYTHCSERVEIITKRWTNWYWFVKCWMLFVFHRNLIQGIGTYLGKN